MLKKAKPLFEKIDLLNKRSRLLKKNDRLLVAVSGGPDSVALLSLLSLLRRKYSFTLHAAHLNHGLFKKQAKRHEVLVRQTCRALQVPLALKRIDLRKTSKQRSRPPEEAGREARYRFFESAAARTKSQKIVTAHTLDDQAETILLRIVRGAGLRGLTGIPPKRRQGKREVVRPLLYCRKKELLSFLKANGLKFGVDRSNADERWRRNRVRHSLLPYLARHFNPRIAESLAHLQSICEEWQGFMDESAAKAYRRCLQRPVRGRRIRLRLSALERLSPALRHEVFRRALSNKKGDLKRVTYRHLTGIDALLVSGGEGPETHLPVGLRVRKKNGCLEIF